MIRFLPALLFLAACAQEPESRDHRTLPAQEPIESAHILNYLNTLASQQLPASIELPSLQGTATPMEQLMLGLALAASPDRGTEAVPFLANALRSDAIEWHPSGQLLAELLLRRTRAELHYREAKQAADTVLASERVRRRELEVTVEALRQIDREMHEESTDEHPESY